jgi:hypothetical protein
MLFVAGSLLPLLAACSQPANRNKQRSQLNAGSDATTWIGSNSRAFTVCLERQVAVECSAMNQTRNKWLVGIFLIFGFSTQAVEIQFGGYTWTVRSGRGGPGPNAWDTNNVWLDAATNLHLKISHRGGNWSCAEITMRQRVGFGRYQFQTSGRLDRLDDNVVLGLFNYPTGDVGQDGTHEIDIEYARWGEAKNPMGNFTVWPVEKSLKHVTKSFPFSLAGEQMTHRFTWRRGQILFQSLEGCRSDDHEELSRWLYNPPEPTRSISQQAMPVHINLWLFKGRPPKSGQEVEIIIRAFKFTPE